MLHSLAVAKNNIYHSNYHWQLILLGAILGLVIVAVAQTNNQAGQSFAMRKLEMQKQDLNEQIRQLNWAVGSYRSLEAVKNRAQTLSLAAPNDVSFIEGSLETVAVAK